MRDEEAWERFIAARVARMATVGLYDRPHIVPDDGQGLVGELKRRVLTCTNAQDRSAWHGLHSLWQVGVAHTRSAVIVHNENTLPQRVARQK